MNAAGSSRFGVDKSFRDWVEKHALCDVIRQYRLKNYYDSRTGVAGVAKLNLFIC